LSTTEKFRLETLINLRQMIFGSSKSKKKIILKRNIHEAQED